MKRVTIVGAGRLVTTKSNTVVPRLGELLLDRMRRNSHLSLADLCNPDGGFSEPGAELTDHLLRNRWGLAAWLGAAVPGFSDELAWERGPAGFLRVRLARWLQQKNQFLRVDGAASRELQALYRRSLRDAARVLSSPAPEARVADGLRDVFDAHQEGIASFLRGRLGECPRDAVCAEYSPSLQLGVLGLRLETLPGPVLDVGCGPRAALVRHLRAEGLPALGIDRDAPEDVALVADWLAFPYGTDRWGTVVSHLGLSLHFLRHHLGGGSEASALATAHAKAYMGILRSLRVGGIFAYAPGLPFMEALLPSSYRPERVALPRELVTDALLAAREASGLDPGHATRVRRLA